LRCRPSALSSPEPGRTSGSSNANTAKRFDLRVDSSDGRARSRACARQDDSGGSDSRGDPSHHDRRSGKVAGHRSGRVFGTHRLELRADTKGERDFTSQLASLVSIAASQGIRVDALAGDPKWPLGPSDADVVLQYVQRFNRDATHRVPFRHLQFDVKPWALPQWQENPQDLVAKYLDWMSSLVDLQQRFASDISLEFAIPYWFDGANPDIANTTHKGHTALPIQHVLDELERSPRAELFVMAYRDHVDGANGIAALFARTLTAAASRKGRTPLHVGVDTSDTQPTFVTFFGAGRNVFLAAMRHLDAVFRGDAHFAGIAVNDAPGMLYLASNER
jgi:hypothetical protein